MAWKRAMRNLYCKCNTCLVEGTVTFGSDLVELSPDDKDDAYTFDQLLDRVLEAHEGCDYVVKISPVKGK